MSAIKLYEIEPMDAEYRRFQSQLFLGRIAADFILEDGVMFTWSGNETMPWQQYDEPYIIVENIEDMYSQDL